MSLVYSRYHKIGATVWATAACYGKLAVSRRCEMCDDHLRAIYFYIGSARRVSNASWLGRQKDGYWTSLHFYTETTSEHLKIRTCIHMILIYECLKGVGLKLTRSGMKLASGRITQRRFWGWLWRSAQPPTLSLFTRRQFTLRVATQHISLVTRFLHKPFINVA